MPRLTLIALLGGAGGLLLELAWIREFSLVFTQATLATSVLLACYLGGLAAGTAAAPRLAGRFHRLNHLQLFALAEGIGAALGLLSGLALPHAAVGLQGLWAEGNAFAEVRMLAQVVVGAVFVVPATFCLGLSFPFLAAASSSEAGSAGIPARAGFLQAVNTLGGAGAVLLAGFYLIPLRGIQQTFTLAAVSGGAAAVLALVGARSRTRVVIATAEESAPRPVGPAAGAGLGDMHVSLVALLLAGAAVLAQEVVLSRLLLQVLGGTLAAIATVLAAFLVGLALGGMVGAALARRSLTTAKAASWFLVTQGLAALLTLAYPFVLPHVPELAFSIRKALGVDFASLAGSMALVCGLLLLPITLLFGTAYPLSMAARRHPDVVTHASSPLAWSTLGSIAGSLVAGFVLIPQLGLFRSIAAAAALGMAAAVLVIPRTARVRPLAIAAGLGLPLVVGWSLDRTSEVALARIFFSNQVLRRFDTGTVQPSGTPPVETLYYAVGPSATVLVEGQGPFRSLYLNGKIVASTTIIDQKNQVMLGHLPLLMKPDAKRAMVVGMGTGGTIRSVLCHPVETVICAELSREVLGAAEFFGVPGDPDLDDPRLHIAFDDARNVLRSAHEPFDVITSDPVHPWVAGAASLYTEEYYRIVRSKLGPQGVFAQWLPLYEMGREDMRAIIATFMLVFPDAELWAAHYDVILVARRDGLVEGLTDVPLSDVRERFTRPEVTRSLASVSIESVEDLLSHLIAGPAELETFAASGILVRDDRLVLEATVPRSLFAMTQGENLVTLMSLSSVERRLELIAERLRGTDLLSACRIGWLRDSVAARDAALRWVAALYRDDDEAAALAWAQAIVTTPGLRLGSWTRRIPAALEARVERHPDDALAWLGLAWSRFRHAGEVRSAGEAAGIASRAIEASAGEVRSALAASLWVLQARLAGAGERWEDGLELVTRAVTAKPCSPEARRLHVLLQLRREDAPGARQAWLALHEIDPDGVETWALGARVLSLEGEDEAARDLAHRVTERDPSNILVGPLLAE